ncbi:RNA polymerase sigma-70 factor [Pseudoflavitalea sp. G-6-1-2]|uniref:RNA polymerase sigma factor n=1 Tax=Pseudoflavitalea sp. G-6-1-2 TaxID=2728841 RepID=UPI00146C0C97|nr:RNA polymerase sigma-70 factor [Pseudoflavitalea sp. G-6-1-2]NML22487.1 RNA polymerase sigma-70 factor [Pseudoflavitalea sp. G-6-1-2]
MAEYEYLHDHELAAKLSEGSDAAFAAIYQRYHLRLFLFAFKKLGNREEAKDVVQEVFTKLWNRHADYNISTSLSSYLFTAVRNAAFDLFTHKKIEAKYIDSLQHFLDKDPVATDHLVRAREMSLQIEKEIAALPPRMREVFELSRKEHLSHLDIAEKLQISESTVTGQIKKALRILRLRLGSLFLFLLFMQS